MQKNYLCIYSVENIRKVFEVCTEHEHKLKSAFDTTLRTDLD